MTNSDRTKEQQYCPRCGMAQEICDKLLPSCEESASEEAGNAQRPVRITQLESGTELSPSKKRVPRFVKADTMREEGSPDFMPHLPRWVRASDYDAEIERLVRQLEAQIEDCTVNYNQRVVLTQENDMLRAALERIANLGVTQVSNAVMCAREALGPAQETESSNG